MDPERLPLIKIVGPSASGKSTLARALRAHGYDARPVGQEHSAVPDLWLQFGVPRVLIFLDVDMQAQRERRGELEWNEDARRAESARLAHAREKADLVISSSTLSPPTVLAIALAWLRYRGIRAAALALPPVGLAAAPSAKNSQAPE